MITLTKEQAKHYDSIKWLLFGPRACGRTHLMATLFVERAFYDTLNRVYVFDHERSHHSYNHHPFQMIQNVFNDSGYEPLASMSSS